MEEKECTMVKEAFLQTVMDHAKKRGLKKTRLAAQAFPEEGDSLRKLNRLLKEEQQLNICDAFDLAKAIGEPLSHLILDVEGRMRGVLPA